MTSAASPFREPGRAAPLPPEERRATIVRAALPLVRVHGTDVTTKQIAEAAGIAEGTIFRVFPDKNAIIDAVVERAFDNDLAIAALGAVPSGLPVRETVAAICEIFRARLAELWQLMASLGAFGGRPGQVGRPAVPPHRSPDHEDAINAAVVELLVPYAADLRVPPVEAARLVRLVLFSTTHPRITDGDPLSTPDIIALLFDGLERLDTTSMNGSQFDIAPRDER